LLRERIFDDVLVREGVVTHYLPLGPAGEKGVDVWLALEAYELAIHKRFDIVVLLACDGDFLPLVRKLNTVGTRVMLMAWDFKFVDRNSEEKETRTAQVLLDEVTYPVMMHHVIEDRSRRSDPLVAGLFVPVKESRGSTSPAGTPAPSPSQNGNRQHGAVHNLKAGYGFIAPQSGAQNLFFFHAEVLNADFNDLRVGSHVTFTMGTNHKGPCATDVEIIGAAG
jgi:cold shock CspA family protein